MREKKTMIKLEILDDERQTFLVTGDEPYRVEVAVLPGGRILTDVYPGDTVDMDQAPVGGYDGTMSHSPYSNGTNQSWEYDHGKVNCEDGIWAYPE